MPESSSKLKRRLFIIAGTLSVGIGVVGIVVPVLPTTPFLLLAAFCYMRGSQRLYNTLLCNRFLGCYVKNYLEGKGMSLKMKIWTLSWLWIAIGFIITFVINDLVVRILLGVVLLGVTTHIALIKVTRCSDR